MPAFPRNEKTNHTQAIHLLRGLDVCLRIFSVIASGRAAAGDVLGSATVIDDGPATADNGTAAVPDTDA